MLAVSAIPAFVFDGPVRAFSMDVIGALDRNGGDLIFDLDDRPDVLLSGTLPEGNRQFLGFIDLVVPFTRGTFFSSARADNPAGWAQAGRVAGLTLTLSPSPRYPSWRDRPSAVCFT